MACSACGGSVEQGDSYCRRCGRPVEGRLLPVPVVRQLPAERPMPVPRVVVGGMVALLLAKLARWALRQAFAGITRNLGQTRAIVPSKGASPAQQLEGVLLPPGSRVVTRVWWHQEIYVPPAPDSKPRRRGLFGR